MITKTIVVCYYEIFVQVIAIRMLLGSNMTYNIIGDECTS